MGVNGHDDRTQCNEGGIFMNDFIFVTMPPPAAQMMMKVVVFVPGRNKL